MNVVPNNVIHVKEENKWMHITDESNKYNYCIFYTDASNLIFYKSDSFYDVFTLFPADVLDQLREQNLLSRWVGGFISLMGKINHIIAYIICKGRLVVCDSRDDMCTGSEFAARLDISDSNGDNHFTNYHITYVFTPSDKIGPAQFRPEEVEEMGMFELKKRFDYWKFSGDLNTIPPPMLEEGVPVRTNHGVGYTVSRKGNRVVVDLISAGRQEYNIDELKHVPWEDRVRTGEFRPLKSAR